MEAVVGAARIVFGADTSEFEERAGVVRNTLIRLKEKLQEVERSIKQVGVGFTLGITVPFAAMVKTVDRGAGSFEKQMKNVEAALDSVSGDQLKALSDQARALGPAVGKGATEAAEGIEALGLAGVSTADILGGALKATLDLSTAGMVDASVSASLVTDVMGQFKVTAGELPRVVQNVVGALDSSKFGFDDFRLAVGQGGAVAASAGVSFLDFSTAISATSTQFTSGADAGTSFKTYIQSLVGNSDQAKAAMKKLGISFFDANGQMKPLAEQAQILRDKLGNLTDASKTEALKTIFGSDAARTAIGLMEAGREGFEKLQETVAGGDVEAKIQKRMEGTEAAGKRIAVAWESVKIAIGLDTGILHITTAIKNAFADMLEAIANAPVWVKQVGAAFSALGAVMGPLLLVLGHVGAMILAQFAAARFGIIGRVIGFIIAPISTLITMLGQMGLARVLAMVAGRLLALAGPVGWVVGAILMFKDSIATALRVVWESFTKTLGPPLEALFAKVQVLVAKLQDMFGKIANGPIGAALSGLASLFMGVADVLGTVLVAAIEGIGKVIEYTLTVAIAALSGFVDVLSGIVDLITALLTGDFSGAWDALVGVIESAVGAIVDVIGKLYPEIEGPLQSAYEGAKSWLADGFSDIAGWMSDAIKSGVDYIAKTFPGVVAAAKSVYEGVKAWLVDAFGWILDYVGKAVAWIVDAYGSVKRFLGIGEASSAAPAPKPEAKPKGGGAAPAAPKRSVSFDDDDDKKKRKKKGRDPQRDQQNREQLEFQNQLDAARLRGDVEAERALRRKLELSQQIEAYQKTGLSLAAATAAAQRDMANLDAARAVGLGKALAIDEEGHRIDVARISGNRSLQELLERQREIRQRIEGYLEKGLTLAQATFRATQQQLEIDRERERVRKRMLADAELERQYGLAEARGDSARDLRDRRRELDVRRRQDELMNGGMSEEGARNKAEAEWDELDKARQTGVFRETFRDGVRAALDGDLKGWFQNWWRDRVAKGMEQALNSLADLISKLFSQIGGNGGAGGGGLGGILGGIGKMLGFGGGGLSDGALQSTSAAIFAGLPGLATGGDIRIGGRSGIDQNLLSINGIPTARVGAKESIRVTPKNDNGAARGTNVFDLRGALMTADLMADINGRIANGSAAAMRGAVSTVETRSAKRSKRRLGARK